MNQNFNGFYIFYRVAQIGNISKASEILYVSQPAVSKAISKLEEQLGTKLFKRTAKGVELTDDGQRLYAHLKIAFTAIEDGEKELSENLSQGFGKIKIGASATICRHLLVPYLESFISENSTVRVQISCQSSADTIRLIENGELDVGLVAQPAESGSLEFIHVAELEYIFVASPSYLDSLCNGEKLSGEQILSKANVLLLDEHNSSRMYVDGYLQSNGINLSRTMEATNMDLLIDYAKIGLGVSCVIKKFVEKYLSDGRLVKIPLKHKIPIRNAVFAYRQSNLSERSVKAFIDSITH